MTFEEIESLAKKNEPLPERTNLEEYFCYELLSYLYKYYRVRRITHDEARQRKGEIRAKFQDAATLRAQQEACWASHQASIRKGEYLTCEIRKAIESRADASTLVRLTMELYGNLTGDFITPKIITNRIEGKI